MTRPTYTGWLLNHGEALGVFLLEQPPVFPVIKMHHVTHEYGGDTAPTPSQICVVGYARDDRCECYVVEVQGTTVRPDGRTYHVTISHVPGARASDSNELLKKGWERIPKFYLSSKPFVASKVGDLLPGSWEIIT